MNPIRLRVRFQVCLFAAFLACWPAVVFAAELDGTKTIFANTRDKQRIPLGTVRFSPRGGGVSSFEISMDHARFADYFLSMKEFKCLDGKVEIVCHVPYPYSNPRTVSAMDMSWLEHDLLFLFKRPGEFGASMRNGLYFRLEPDERGWVGSPQAIDLNYISAPPDAADVAPYDPATRDDVAPGERWIESLLIE